VTVLFVLGAFVCVMGIGYMLAVLFHPEDF
jgi:hypothetical protein